MVIVQLWLANYQLDLYIQSVLCCARQQPEITGIDKPYVLDVLQQKNVINALYPMLKGLIMSGMTESNEYVRVATADDLLTIIESFNKHSVNYILIGGFALQFHGHSRATEDIDFLVQPTKEQGLKIIESLKVLADQESANLDPIWFEEGDGISLLDEIKVDLLFKTSGGTYSDLIKDTIQIKIGNVK